jgi:maltose/moltooligosaccharide transporter
MATGTPPASSSTARNEKKPRLGFWQIFNMSVGFLGIQFGFALQNGNASRILQTFGADVEHLSWFWLVAPLTGMIVQPIIGHYSDRTWTRLGRRRPYFLTGALLAAVGLILMPNAGMFTAILPALWVGAGMLMIMDASFNIAMEPFRALVADKLPNSQRTLGYSVQTGLIGLGAVIGSWLPYMLANWFGVRDVAEAGKIPDNVIYSFVFGALVLVGAIVWTIVTTKEYSPEEQKRYSDEAPVEEHGSSGLVQIFRDFRSMPRTMRQLGLVQFFSWFALFCMWVFATPAITRSKYDMTITTAQLESLKGIANTIPAANGEEQRKLDDAKKFINQPIDNIDEGNGRVFIQEQTASYFLGGKLVQERDLVSQFYNTLSLQRFDNSDYKSAVKELQSLQENYADGNESNNQSMTYPTYSYALRYSGIAADPATLQRLSLAGELKKVVYEYNQGGNWVSGLFGIYNGVSAVFAFFLPLLAMRMGRKLTHAFALVCGGLGLLSIYVINDPNLLVFSMIGIGIAWASILAMPYVILSGSIPAAKMGIYMGIFNFFITLPQIVSSLSGGPIVKYFFNNEAIYALVLAGVLMICAAISVVYVYDPADNKPGDNRVIQHNEVL